MSVEISQLLLWTWNDEMLSFLTTLVDNKSAIAEYSWTEDHLIRWDYTKILQHASQTTEF